MIKYFSIILTVFLFMTMGCKKENNIVIPDQNMHSIQRVQSNIIEIRERMFIGQVNDVYLNTKDYLGKIIKLEGIFINEPYNNNPYYYVIRYGVGGCCGNDQYVGFEVRGNQGQPFPDNDSWVEAAGILKVDDNNRYLYLDLITLTVLDRRGTEYVTQ